MYIIQLLSIAMCGVFITYVYIERVLLSASYPMYISLWIDSRRERGTCFVCRGRMLSPARWDIGYQCETIESCVVSNVFMPCWGSLSRLFFYASLVF